MSTQGGSYFHILFRSPTETNPSSLQLNMYRLGRPGSAPPEGSTWLTSFPRSCADYLLRETSNKKLRLVFPITFGLCNAATTFHVSTITPNLSVIHIVLVPTTTAITISLCHDGNTVTSTVPTMLVSLHCMITIMIEIAAGSYSYCYCHCHYHCHCHDCYCCFCCCG